MTEQQEPLSDELQEPEDIGDDTEGDLTGNPTGYILELHEVLEWENAVIMNELEGEDGNTSDQ